MNPKIRQLQIELTQLFHLQNEKTRQLCRLLDIDIELQDHSKRPKIRALQQAAANFFNVDASSMKSRLRTTEIVWPRFAAMVLCRELTRYSTKEIAEEFGRRDHSGVAYGVAECISREQTDVQWSREMIELRRIARHTLDNMDMPLFATPAPEGKAAIKPARRTYPATKKKPDPLFASKIQTKPGDDAAS